MIFKKIAFVFLSLVISFPVFATKDSYRESLNCMTTALFKEANTEPEECKIAVAWVIMNRVKSNGFPNTVCGVVRHSDFTFKNKNMTYRRELSSIAHKVLTKTIVDNTNGSTHFHHERVRPTWSFHYAFNTQCGVHKFYTRI